MILCYEELVDPQTLIRRSNYGAIFIKLTLGTSFLAPPHKTSLPCAASSNLTRPVALNVKERLAALNEKFLYQHRINGKSALHHVHHVVVLFDAKLSLWHKVENIRFAQIASAQTGAKQNEYTLLKQISHIPVLLMSLLQPVLDDLSTINDIHSTIDEVRTELNSLATDLVKDPATAVHINMVLKSLWLLDNIKNSPSDNTKKLVNIYLRTIHHDLKEKARAATQVQLTSMRVIEDWLKQYHIELKATRVLIVGTHGPRNKLVEQQFLEALYEKHGLTDQVDDRIFYVEMLPKNMSSLDIHQDLIQEFLGSCELNKHIGHWTFNNKKAMFADILHEHGPSVLKDLGLTEAKALNTADSRCPFHNKK